MKFIARYLRPQMQAIIIGLSIKFTGTVIELLLPWMLSVILDDIVPRQDMRGMAIWAFLMALSVGGALLGNAIANRKATRVSRDFTQVVRRDLFDKITRLSCAQIDTHTVPSLVSRLTNDTYNLHQMVDRMQRLGVRAPIMLLGGVSITFAMEPVLALVLLAVLPLMALLVFVVTGKGINMYTSTQAALDNMIRRAQESIAGIRVIRALSKEDYEEKRFAEASGAVAENDYRAAALMSLTNPAMNFLLNIGLTLVVVVGAFRVNSGLTSPGAIVAFLSYFTIILNAIMTASRLFVVYTKGVASGQRIAEILSLPAELEVEERTPGTGNAHIRFENVGFSYAKVWENLSGISFEVGHGETLGVIGATGSGKTTLIQLLLRFYDPDNGAVYLDGQDLRAIPPEILHTKFGVVFQNDFLYSGSIAENIDLGRGLPKEKLIAAANAAQASFIDERRGGYEGELAPGGADLSGGQRQRLLIARALAARPDVLIFDDSSSALDYKTDAALRRALKAEFAGTTKLIVAQRISSIQNADKILVLDEGRIIGCGTHEQLLERCPVYRDIAEFQLREVE
jgi:ATP-binding cassette subfamily B protein